VEDLVVILTLPAALIEWTNIAWPELLRVGGLGAIQYRVVDRLPFGKDAAAMTWRGEVLVQREWIQPALADLGPNNQLNLRHLWAVAILAWHEPLHVLEQHERPWILYLLRYVWQWMLAGFRYREIDEESRAYEHQHAMSQRWYDTHPGTPPVWSRPQT
jgi:hypothetical protein